MVTYNLSRPPAESFQNMRRLNTLLEDAFSWPLGGESSSVTAAWLPPVDVFENKDAVKIVAELPGVKPGDVRISLENSTLSLKGEKQQVAEESTDRVHRYERTYGAFERTFSLPSTVDADRIEAVFENGVLTISIPKVERAKPRQIEVKAK